MTRQQLATFFRTYAEKKGYDVSATADLSKFEDAGKIGAWAEAGMKWAVGAGLISGTSETTVSPQGVSTRAQVAVIARNFIENIVK